MVAITAREADRFVSSPPASIAVFLIYGPDAGLVSERADMIARARARGQTIEQIRLNGDDAAGEPGRLVDEMNALSMFGDHRLIRVRLGSRTLAGIDVIVANPNRSSTLVIEAGDLKPTQGLRSLIEKSPTGAAVPCYADDGQAIDRLIDDVMTAAGVTLVPEARALLRETLGADRLRSRAELDKLALHAGPGGTVDMQTLEALLTDAAPPLVDALIDGAMLGEIEEIEARSRRVWTDGLEPGVMIGMALRHTLQLASLVRNAGGAASPEAIKRMRFHWKRERAIRLQTERWTEARLNRQIEALQDTIIAIRRTPALGEALAVRALWSMALAAGRTGSTR